jgi:hypothetical protein
MVINLEAPTRNLARIFLLKKERMKGNILQKLAQNLVGRRHLVLYLNKKNAADRVRVEFNPSQYFSLMPSE